MARIAGVDIPPQKRVVVSLTYIHGIGRQMHEDPQVPNFGTAGTPPRLKPGITLAIEPMVNAGTHEVYMKPDGWTICTADGALSAYFEHTVAITEKGPIVLTKGALD